MDEGLYKHSFKTPERPLASLSVYNTGLQRCEPDCAWGPGMRDHYLIHYVIAGRGSYTLRGRTYALSAGDMFLAPPEERIAYRADAQEPWEYCWVGFHGLDARLLLEQTGFAPERPVLHFEERETPCALLLDIYHARGGRAFEAARMTGRLYAFLAWLMENAHTERPGARRPGEEHVRRACAFIANNFADAITVEDIARSVGVCRSRLHCVFQQAMEISPAQYLARFRIRQACRLLRETDLSVKAVAYSVGYEDPLYFSRRFREIMGCPPSRYAQQEASGAADAR